MGSGSRFRPRRITKPPAAKPSRAFYDSRSERAGAIVTCDLELLETNGNADRPASTTSVRGSRRASSLMNRSSSRLSAALARSRLLRPGEPARQIRAILAKFPPGTRGPRLFGRPPAVAEIRQIIGRPFRSDAFTLKDGSKLIAGTNGALFISNDVETYRRVLELYCFAQSIQSFLTNTFSHMWMTWDRLSQVKEMIRDDGIRKIMEIQDVISDLTGDISMFDTRLAYVNRSAAKGDEILPVIRNESMAEEEDLLSGAPARRRSAKLRNRVDDAHLIVEGLQKEIQRARVGADARGERDLSHQPVHGTCSPSSPSSFCRYRSLRVFTG